MQPNRKMISPVLIGAVPVRPYAAPIARRFHQVCLSATAEALRAEALVPLQWGVLAELRAEPGIDQSDLAARLGVDRTNAGLLVDQLEKRGLVQRRIHPNDRRARQLSLTTEGGALFAKLSSRIIALQNSILESALTKGEAKMLLKLLVRVIQANERHARPGGGRRSNVRTRPTSASTAAQ
jgi:DNA-binding MarR family transcriptional regulator